MDFALCFWLISFIALLLMLFRIERKLTQIYDQMKYPGIKSPAEVQSKMGSIDETFKKVSAATGINFNNIFETINEMSDNLSGGQTIVISSAPEPLLIEGGEEINTAMSLIRQRKTIID